MFLSAIFCWIGIYVLIFYFLNISAPLVGTSAFYNNGNISYGFLILWWNLVTDNWNAKVVACNSDSSSDLMQVRSENMGGHIAHLADSLFGFIFIKLWNGWNVVKLLSTVLDFFYNLFRKRVLPSRKVHIKIMANQSKKYFMKLQRINHSSKLMWNIRIRK
jgi:hypothetical protein